MRIGVFGGSLDPIHHGHLLAVQSLREALALDEVRLIPAGAQPFKPAGHGATGGHRLAMVDLAVRGAAGLVADGIEVERPGPSFTVETLRALAARTPGAELVLLLGADAAATLSGWREADAIPTLARVVTFTRGGAPGAGAAEVPVPAIGISSTAIRARARDGRSLRYWVPDAVAEYIAAHRLYQDGQS